MEEEVLEARQFSWDRFSSVVSSPNADEFGQRPAIGRREVKVALAVDVTLDALVLVDLIFIEVDNVVIDVAEELEAETLCSGYEVPRFASRLDDQDFLRRISGGIIS